MSDPKSPVHGKRSRPTSAWLGPACRVALTAIGVLMLAPPAARAAQLQLRAECRCQRPVVTLGDVADVFTADPQEARTLAALELFPAPPPGGKRFLRVREIQDLLVSRGINLLDHGLSGASQVVVFGPGESIEPAGNVALSAVTIRKGERRIRDALVQYLREHVSDAEPWTVDFTLADAQARRAVAPGGRISVRGGQPPWIGAQRFEVALNSTDGSTDGLDRFLLDVRVTLPPAVVVTTRSLPRGALIRAADVELHQGRTFNVHDEAYHSIDEVVGRETTRAVPAGEMLRQSWVRQPLLVRRGEVITVYARSAGVRVRTTARARDDGSLGALIAVESLADRKAYFARVSGVQEVEVYARPTQADAAAATRSAWPTGGGPAPRASRQRWAVGGQQPATDPRLATRRLGP